MSRTELVELVDELDRQTEREADQLLEDLLWFAWPTLELQKA